VNVTAGDDSAMTEPDDFGFNTVRTMTHVVDPVPSLDHSGFWKRWYTRLLDVSPILRPRIVDDPSDPSATHEFESLAGVKVGCALVVPKNAKPIERALVTTHGYTNPDSLGDSVRHWQTIADQGVAVLIVRLRGYRGSQIGIGDMTTPDAIGAGWIARGFGGHKPEEWILPDAVGDVCNAVRVMRDILLRRGEIDLDAVVEVALQMAKDGAVILDIGGESTNTIVEWTNLPGTITSQSRNLGECPQE